MAVTNKRKRTVEQAESTSKARAIRDAAYQRGDKLDGLHGRDPEEAARPREQLDEKFRATGDFMKTQELLEGVLMHLDRLDLYVLRRVCKRWRDTIITAPPIARKLFIRTTSAPADKLARRKAGSVLPVRLNPLLERRRGNDAYHTRHMRETAAFHADLNVESPARHIRVPPDKNDLLEVLCEALAVGFRWRLGKPWSVDLAGGTENSSWEGYISDPPTPDVLLYLQFKQPSIGVLVKVFNPRGVKLRDLVTRAFDTKHSVYNSLTGKSVVPRRPVDLRKELNRVAGGGVVTVEIDESQTFILLQGCDIYDDSPRRTRLAAFNP